jgi:hypothetical protein
MLEEMCTRSHRIFTIASRIRGLDLWWANCAEPLNTFAASLLDPQSHFKLLGRSSWNEMRRVNYEEGMPVRTWDGFQSLDAI